MAIGAHQIAFCNLGLDTLKTSLLNHLCDAFNLGGWVTMIKVHLTRLKTSFAVHARCAFLRVDVRHLGFAVPIAGGFVVRLRYIHFVLFKPQIGFLGGFNPKAF